jgi:hypothetical protein
MAATWNIFQNELESILKLKQSTDFSDFADKFSSAFSRSTLNLATTSFGQPLVYGNYNSIKLAIKLFLDFNRNIESNLERLRQSLNELTKFLETINVETAEELKVPDTLHPFLKTAIKPKIQDINKSIQQLKESGNQEVEQLTAKINSFKNYVDNLNLAMVPYIFLEYSFISFWLTSKFAATPPVPPTIAPLFGTIVLFPGVPGILSIAFKTAFTSKDPSNAASIITQGFQSHSKTITGTYSGLIASPTGPIPSPPIPWIGVI